MADDSSLGSRVIDNTHSGHNGRNLSDPGMLIDDASMLFIG